VSNFGLLDQIAALHWIKENIQEFGGDPGSVTLMGHGTGAACVNYLMVSPVSQGTDGMYEMKPVDPAQMKSEVLVLWRFIICKIGCCSFPRLKLVDLGAQKIGCLSFYFST
jgi:hypothetical protein